MSCPDAGETRPTAAAFSELKALDSAALDRAAGSDHPESSFEQEPVSLDGFYGGRFTLIQPRKTGYRSGLDALLLAATLVSQDRGRAADLGAGAGAVGFAACCRNAAVTMRLVENQEIMADLARQSLALPRNADFAGRIEVIEGDLLAGRAARETMGLADASFDHVLTNPPFHPHDHRPSPDALRAGALMTAAPDFLARWIGVSAALLAPDGRFAAILRTDALAAVLSACEGRLGALRILPVHTRFGEPAGRVLLLARRGSRAPLSLLPGLVLRDRDNRPTDMLKAVEAGTADLPPRS